MSVFLLLLWPNDFVLMAPVKVLLLLFWYCHWKGFTADFSGLAVSKVVDEGI